MTTPNERNHNERTHWDKSEDDRVMAMAGSPSRDPEGFDRLARELGRTTKAVAVRWSRMRDFRETRRQDSNVVASALAALDDGLKELVAVTTAHTQALEALLKRVEAIEDEITTPVDESEPEHEPDPLARWRK